MKLKKTCPNCKSELVAYYKYSLSDAEKKVLTCPSQRLKHGYIWHLPSSKEGLKCVDSYYDHTSSIGLIIFYFNDKTHQSEIYQQTTEGKKILKLYDYKININKDFFDLIKNYNILL